MDIHGANPHQNAPLLKSRVDRGRPLGKALNNHGRTMHRFIGLDDTHPNPSGSDLPKPHIIGAHFFGGFDRQSVAGSSAIDWKNQYSHHFSFQIQYWRSGLATLRGNIGPYKGGTEILVQIFEIESSDHPERW